MKKVILILTLSIGSFLFFTNSSLAQSQSAYCAYTNLNENLWYGNIYNNRVEVKTLQNFLFNYYDVLDEASATGYFGKLTKFYVTQFQKDFSINKTGGLGPITRNKIISICGGNIVGGDRDEHGCIASAGYSWCAVKNKCLRSWEESCGKVDESNGGPNCKVWYDGCNTCSRQNVGGPMMCTLMACIQGGDANWLAAHQPVCREYFTTNVNTTPIIKSFSGPVQLNINEKGTWKVDASIYNNESLTYNITWGDENYFDSAKSTVANFINSVVLQNTTFEHAYSRTGTFTVTIEVKSQDGQSTKTTSTVNVTNKITASNPESDGTCKKWKDSYGGECRRDYVNGPVADCFSWRAKYFYFPNLTPVCTEYFTTTN